MIYIKTKLDSGEEVRIELTDENTYAICPRCGREHSIVLSEFFQCEGFDLDCEIYCVKCSTERELEREHNLELTDTNPTRKLCKEVGCL